MVVPTETERNDQRSKEYGGCIEIYSGMKGGRAKAGVLIVKNEKWRRPIKY